LTLYEYIKATGNIPEDFIGDKIIDIYHHNDYGLCLGMFGTLLSLQKHKDWLTASKVITKARNVEDLAYVFGAKSIAKMEPLKTFPLSAKMLSLSPARILQDLFLLLKWQKITGRILIPELKDIL